MKQEERKEKAFPTSALLASGSLSGYQKDFARALLIKPAYTLQEAKKILDKFFGGDK